MKKSLPFAVCLLSLFFSCSFCRAADHNAQDDYEKEIESVVRHKHFYKAGKFELGVLAGVMPYDSIINHYMIAGRATWHISDHYGWEVLDLQKAFPSVTGYTTNLVAQYGITNLQTVKIQMMASSNFLLSPVYGKIHFFGRQVLYFDIYAVGGGGMANTQILQVATPSVGGAVSQNILKTGWDPMFDLGFGFKIFTSDGLGLLIDMRDYVVDSTVYNNPTLKSNFAVYAGLSFFLPWFGG